MKKIFSSLLMATMMISMIPLQSSAIIVLPDSNEPNPATVKAAFAEFKNLSRKEQKLRVKEAKKQVKIFQKEKKTKIIKKDKIVIKKTKITLNKDTKIITEYMIN